jgi:hypothetical protein
MSAAELRKAAETLRERAESASPPPWRPYEQHGRDITDEGWSEIGVANDGHDVAHTYPTGFENDYPEPDAVYIATMHPGVGLALADWLDHEATIGAEDEEMGYQIGPRYPGLVLARLINGGAA